MQPAPRWTVQWPTNAPAFRDVPIDDGVRTTLRYNQGREATWNPVLSSAPSPSERAFLFFFRWEPGGSSVVRARAHRPDICLPAAGWRQVGDTGVQPFRVTDDIALPFRQVDFTNVNGATTAHTFFCIYEDRRTNEARPDLALPAGLQPDWSFAARWRAVRNGVRNMGQQVLEFVLVTSRPASPESARADFARILPGLIQEKR
jgi:hypothetical protein